MSDGLRATLGDAAARAGVVAPDLEPWAVEARWADERSRFLDVDGARTHYRDEGAGADGDPTLLLVHGTFASLHTWDPWVDRLADEYRVVRVDLPGHGLTGPHAGGYRMADFVAFLERVREVLGLESVVVAGNSRGGEVAWRYALDHPDRVAGLVLLDSMGYPVPSRPAVAEAVTTPALERAFRWVTPKSLVRRTLSQVYHDPTAWDESTVERYHDLLRREGNREALVAIVERDLDPTHRHEELTDLAVPTLVQWGDHDAWIPPSVGEQFAHDVPGAVHRTYPAGHVPMEERPAATASDLRAFLDSHVG
jgi:pimeloyl-ACP methyl ester carboxylesterase